MHNQGQTLQTRVEERLLVLSKKKTANVNSHASAYTHNQGNQELRVEPVYGGHLWISIFGH